MPKHIAILAAILAAIGVAAYIFRQELSEALYMGPPRMIVAEVRFTNNCPIADSNFVLKDTTSGRTVPFSNGWRISGCWRARRLKSSSPRGLPRCSSTASASEPGRACAWWPIAPARSASGARCARSMTSSTTERLHGCAGCAQRALSTSA